MAQLCNSLIGGGVRSGKSRFALEQALKLGERRVFIATAQAWDDEMRTRIDNHIEERGGLFKTIECPTDLPRTLANLENTDVVLIDCLTLWFSNLLLRGDDQQSIEAELKELVVQLRRRRFHTLMVSNEVGMGIVPEHKLGRLFRDIAGRAHQELAKECDQVYMAVMGMMLQLKPTLAVCKSET